jgi:uncharacterized protein YjiS (DUF1127 family)
MAYSRKNISNAGDRVVLEKAEAREIYRTWQSKDRVRFYMRQMKEGQIE